MLIYIHRSHDHQWSNKDDETKKKNGLAHAVRLPDLSLFVSGKRILIHNRTKISMLAWPFAKKKKRLQTMNAKYK